MYERGALAAAGSSGRWTHFAPCSFRTRPEPARGAARTPGVPALARARMRHTHTSGATRFEQRCCLPSALNACCSVAETPSASNCCTCSRTSRKTLIFLLSMNPMSFVWLQWHDIFPLPRGCLFKHRHRIRAGLRGRGVAVFFVFGAGVGVIFLVFGT